MGIKKNILNLVPKKKIMRAHNLVSVDRKILLSNQAIPFAVREAYHTIATNIVYQPIQDRCRRFIVTSSVPGEGKTTVSINIAATLAQNLGESKVLLIDGDLRKPRIGKLLDVAADIHGLTEYLAGIDETPNICTCQMEGLSVLYSGKTSLNPVGLIASERMDILMEYCKANYDYVIIDTPPVNIVSDTLLFSKHANGYIVTTRSGYSDVNSLNETINSIKMVDGKITGIVLTCAEMKNSGRYGHGHRYGGYSSGNGYGAGAGGYGCGRYGNRDRTSETGQNATGEKTSSD